MSRASNQVGIAVCLAAGLVCTLVLVLPLYAFADVVQKKWGWPLWIQPLIVAGIWLVVWSACWIWNPDGSGIGTGEAVTKATLMFWFVTLPFGIPWLVLGYWKLRRKAGGQTASKNA
jgi:hypothetical protein